MSRGKSDETYFKGGENIYDTRELLSEKFSTFKSLLKLEGKGNRKTCQINCLYKGMSAMT